MNSRWTGSMAVVLMAVLAGWSELGYCAEDAEHTLDASEADGAQVEEEKEPFGSRWNEYDGEVLTLRGGFGYLFDTANYAQDEDSKRQMELAPTNQLRDFRLLFKGKFKKIPHLSYTIGFMYDAPNQDWRFRQTGLMLEVPELHGVVFVGRTKEGFSTSKIMVGYHGWTNERAAANDAFIPILADGVKWIGNVPSGKLVYSLGWFGSVTDQSYLKNGHVMTARAVWLPKAKTSTVLHLAGQLRYGTDLNGTLQYRSKPESFLAQSFAVDTGKFPASHAVTGGLEAYYRPPSRLMFGSEYFLNQVSSGPAQDPFFHGGEAFAAYLFNGHRGYNEKGGFFTAVVPDRPVFTTNGPGAWELVLRYSYVDLDSGTIQGGKFQRITPMANWHMSDNVRLEFVTGYSWLQREGITGTTKYFQTRLQLSL